MDSGLCLPQEYGSFSGNADGSVLAIAKDGVVYKPWDSIKDYSEVCGLIWDFYLHQYDEDLSEIVDVEVRGEKRPMQRVECVLAHFLMDNCKIQLAFVEDEVAGILIYNSIYECILGVRVLSIDPKFSKRGLAKTLVDSLDFQVKKLIFQYYKPKPPVEMLRHTEGRREIINETDKLVTCEMVWGN